MAGTSPEVNETNLDWQRLPLLMRDGQGKYVIPFQLNFKNLAYRINGDAEKFGGVLMVTTTKRQLLKIEEEDAKNVDKLFENADLYIQKRLQGKFITKEDTRNLAAYLDWSYTQEVGDPTSETKTMDAYEHGFGTTDIWYYLGTIRRELDK